MKMPISILSLSIAILCAFVPTFAYAQDTAADVVGATVTEAGEPVEEVVPGTSIRSFQQELTVELSSGEQKGEAISLSNDYTAVAVGDRLFVAQNEDGTWRLVDIDRRFAVGFFALLFAATVIAVGRWRGVRALGSLIGSFAAIFFVLVPLILAGYSPILSVIGVSALLLAIVMYMTHGWNKATHAAFATTVIVSALATVLSALAVALTRMTGFSADAAVFLNASTGGAIDLAALLVGAMVIGAIGVLDDIAVTQIAAVGEIRIANPSLSKVAVFKSAMRIGREHVGALVNTLALAYASVALPVLLLFSKLEAPAWMLINQELFAVEIIRIAVGGTALALAVPLATMIATYATLSGNGAHMHSHTH